MGLKYAPATFQSMVFPIYTVSMIEKTVKILEIKTNVLVFTFIYYVRFNTSCLCPMYRMTEGSVKIKIESIVLNEDYARNVK